MRRIIAAALVMIAALAAPAQAFAPTGVPGRPGPSSGTFFRLLRFPLEFLLPAPPPLTDGATALNRETGWSRLGFPLGDHGSGVLLEVDGHAAFGRAEIVFDDGELLRIELGGAERRDGLFELAMFGRDRRVAVVRLEALSRSRATTLRALLARE